MNPQNTQENNPQATANNAAASLAFATHLSTQMMQHQNPSQVSPEEPEENPETNQEDSIKKIEEDVDALKKEVKGSKVSQEIENIRSELEALLKDEGEEPNEQTDED
jgi:hypothetical protein